MTNVCKSVSSRPTYLYCGFCWNDSACSPFPATTAQKFFQSQSSHTLCSCLGILSSTNNLFFFWRTYKSNKFQKVSTYKFCSWDDIFKQKWNFCSPNNLRKFTKSRPTLSTNTSIEWDLYLSQSNDLVTFFRLERIVGGFSKHQNKTNDADI